MLLSPESLAAFDRDGYVVVRDAVPAENVTRARRAIWEYLGASPEDSRTWYGGRERVNGVVYLYHHQSFWDNRQARAIYDVFATLIGQRALWVSIDRAKMCPPVRDRKKGAREPSGFIHWDVDVTRPLPQPPLQGVLCLSRGSPDNGGFQCVPGYHKVVEQARRRGRATDDVRRRSFSDSDIRVVEAGEGDLIVWSSFLPHGNGRNTSGTPRLAQFIRMFPAVEHDEHLRRRRIDLWRESRAPHHTEPLASVARVTPARLSALGKRLLGLECWPTQVAIAEAQLG